MTLNVLSALTVGVISLYIFYHFLIVKDGIARMLLMAFFGTIGVWAITRGILLWLISEKIIKARIAMDIIGNMHYLIYAPIIFSAIYLSFKKGK